MFRLKERSQKPMTSNGPSFRQTMGALARARGCTSALGSVTPTALNFVAIAVETDFAGWSFGMALGFAAERADGLTLRNCVVLLLFVVVPDFALPVSFAVLRFPAIGGASTINQGGLSCPDVSVNINCPKDTPCGKSSCERAPLALTDVGATAPDRLRLGFKALEPIITSTTT
jgi:hypothetical protein